MQRAIEFYEQALLINCGIGNRQGEANVQMNIGNACYNLGEFPRAIEFHEQALGIFREIGDQRGEGNVLWNLSLAQDKLDNHTQAIANAQAALEIFEQIESPYTNTVREQLAEWKIQNSVSW